MQNLSVKRCLRKVTLSGEPYTAEEIEAVKRLVALRSIRIHRWWVLAVFAISVAIMAICWVKGVEISLLIPLLIGFLGFPLLDVLRDGVKADLTWLQGVSEEPISDNPNFTPYWDSKEALSFFHLYPECERYRQKVAKEGRMVTRIEMQLLKEAVEYAQKKKAADEISSVTRICGYPSIDR